MGLFSIFKKPDTLYYPGCRTYFKHKLNLEIYKKILSKLGIDIINLDGQVCCGLLPLELGYEQEARKLARRNLEFFRENNIKRIITNCPSCYKMFTKNYPEILPDWDIKVENMWELILNKIEKKPRLIKYKSMETVTFHDSCYLGRYCGVYNEPRRILELIGYEIIEMADFKKNSFCAGSCGGLLMIDSELADKIAKQRLLQAKRTRVKKMIVGSLDNYELLKKNSEDIEILEISEVLAIALGIKISIKEEQEEIEESIIIDIETDEKIKEELKEEDYQENKRYKREEW